MNLSYKIRIPLSLVSASLVTVVALGIALSVEAYRNIVEDRIAEGKRLALALTPVLSQALKHDDIWLAYSLLRGPAPGQALPNQDGRVIMILTDAKGVIFASSHPYSFHTGDPLAVETYTRLLQRVAGMTRRTVTAESHNHLVLVRGIYSEDAYQGALIISYPVRTFWARFLEILRSGALPVILILLPLSLLGWYWGSYIIRPLVELTHCMRKLRTADISTLECKVYEGNDEIGELGQQFHKMLNVLREKKALEQQIIAQERLAAIGRLAAGVAHEINNPVGGMLVAVDTWRSRLGQGEDPSRFLDLLERGLNQIRETVSALLVESRIENRPLEQSDIEDVRTLVETQRSLMADRIQWHSRISGQVDVPATAVRQILMNLVTNAMTATEGTEGEVVVEVRQEEAMLSIEVTNTGLPIPPDERAHIFEPFHSLHPGGTGLGLWITYQIVTQLHGHIDFASDNEQTRFTITLPIRIQHQPEEEEKEEENDGDIPVSYRTGRG